jgi:hypothetical protein
LARQLEIEGARVSVEDEVKAVIFQGLVIVSDAMEAVAIQEDTE